LAQQPIILGVDEVGRGPWAGPLVVGAVILGPDFSPENIAQHQNTKKFQLYQDLTDSKKLTAKKRETLAPLIETHALASATGWVTTHELDQYGLSASLKLATRRAIKQILATKSPFTEIIIDGTINFLQNTPLETKVTLLKKADTLIKEVSAASIIAKVARDAYMTKIATQYPAYGFEKHVGYGTALHKSALLEHGICPEHRTSFRPIREIIAQNQQNCTKTNQNTHNYHISTHKSPHFPTPPTNSQKGKTAELVVARYLQAQNHTIISHNFKTKFYEIDLISIKNHQVFFTEVKYSQNPDQEGTALVRVTPEKQRQMHFAAQAFLATHSEYTQLQPLLAAASVSGGDYQIQDWLILE
jgi:ribonuclease HII